MFKKWVNIIRVDNIFSQQNNDFRDILKSFTIKSFLNILF